MPDQSEIVTEKGGCSWRIISWGLRATEVAGLFWAVTGTETNEQAIMCAVGIGLFALFHTLVERKLAGLNSDPTQDAKEITQSYVGSENHQRNDRYIQK